MNHTTEQPIFVKTLTNLLGRSRYLVFVAVLAVMMTAFSLFLIGTVQAMEALYAAWARVLTGKFSSHGISMSLNLNVVSTMLEAVVFYLVGVGLYSLFISPLNVAVALGIESLTDLESKILSVIVVIMGATFLQHFVLWTKAAETLQFAASLAMVVLSLIALQWFGHRATEMQKSYNLKTQSRAQHEMFNESTEQHEVKTEELE
ncbi:MAG: YqhA family protein [Nitrospirae bacterium]|nr:YqhA family protein [Nitrospirota bacterium]